MDKKTMQDKLAKIREAKTKNNFMRQNDNEGSSKKKATGTNSRANTVSGNRKVGSGD